MLVLDQLNDRLRLKLAMLVALLLLLLLPLVHWVWGVPKPALVVTGVVFFIWSPIFWSISRPAIIGIPTTTISRQVAAYLSTGLLLLAIILGSIYWLDRAGWLWFRFTGYETALAEDLSHLVELSPQDFVERNPAFLIDPNDPTRLVLPKGTYLFNHTVLVPQGSILTIEPGTTLRFDAGRSLISYSPIIALGTDNDPVLFTAHNKWLKWGVVGIVQAGPSVFEHVRFEHGRLANVNNIEFFGALSLIETEAEIRYSQFVNLFGKDGIYGRYSHLLVEDNVFQDNFRDGLDMDGGTGRIIRNLFINCGDEGIDLSENDDFDDIQVVDNIILDSKGGQIGAEYHLDEILSINTLGFSNR